LLKIPKLLCRGALAPHLLRHYSKSLLLWSGSRGFGQKLSVLSKFFSSAEYGAMFEACQSQWTHQKSNVLVKKKFVRRWSRWKVQWRT